MRIAVAGGTGTVGRLVVEAARAAGHEPVVLARSRGADLLTGEGVDAALEGEAVVDATNRDTLRRAPAVRFFTAASRTLLAAAARAGVRHHVVLSIVGVDRVGLGYYAGKCAQEDLALASGLPVTVLRSTQWFEFPGQLLARSPGPLALVPRMRCQPVAAREVAQALVATATGSPLGRAPDLAGPEVHEMPDLARRVARARGARRLVVAVRPPGAVGRAMADGGLLPVGDGPRGRQTFDAWLAESAGARPAGGQRPARP